MNEPFFNQCIQDIALDRGEFELDRQHAQLSLQFDMPSVSQGDIPQTGGVVSRGDSIPSLMLKHGENTNSQRRSPKAHVRGLSDNWTRMAQKRK